MLSHILGRGRFIPVWGIQHGVINQTEALALALAHGGKFVAVLLDLTMPGLDGPATLKELRAVNATTPILLMSGFTESDARKRLPGDQYVAFLPKPFTSDELLAALRKLLSRAQPKSATENV